jgi:hypothetical protein
VATFFKFYCLCVKDAWAGSLEKANALATIPGAFIIWVVLWARGYQLILPDTLGYAIVVAVCCLLTAWIVIFFVGFVTAPPKRYATLERELESLKGDFSSEIRRNIDLKITALSSPTKAELYRLADGSIGLHQLSNEAEIELGMASLVTPKICV